VVYRLTNLITGEFYIGLTVVRKGDVKRSLAIRFRGHCYKAFAELKDWPMPAALRKHGPDCWSHEPLVIVRGKAAAHEHEVKLIKKLRPHYNEAST
jgi:hypothetical protein